MLSHNFLLACLLNGGTVSYFYIHKDGRNFGLHLIHLLPPFFSSSLLYANTDVVVDSDAAAATASIEKSKCFFQIYSVSRLPGASSFPSLHLSLPLSLFIFFFF